MKIWRLTPTPDRTGLELVDAPAPEHPGSGQVAVRLKAAALNYRDVLISDDRYPAATRPGVIPGSDAVWEVTAVGDGVSELSVGDRVVNTFFDGWVGGPIKAWMFERGLGAVLDGVLTEQRLFDANMVVRVPDSLSDHDAATLTCAGVTAWSTLMAYEPRLQAGQTVLTLGTGAVSLFVIQFAKACGAKVIVTSSSDEKLERAKALGADVGINYVTNPDWDRVVREVTDGEGANIVVEPGGPPPSTIHKSIASVALGGRIALMGVQADPNDLIHPTAIFAAYASLHGVLVGSRRQLEETLAVMDANNIQAVIDRVYPFEEADRALREFADHGAFGKVVITV